MNKRGVVFARSQSVTEVPLDEAQLDDFEALRSLREGYDGSTGVRFSVFLP